VREEGVSPSVLRNRRQPSHQFFPDPVPPFLHLREPGRPRRYDPAGGGADPEPQPEDHRHRQPPNAVAERPPTRTVSTPRQRLQQHLFHQEEVFRHLKKRPLVGRGRPGAGGGG